MQQLCINGENRTRKNGKIRARELQSTKFIFFGQLPDGCDNFNRAVYWMRPSKPWSGVMAQ